MKRRLQIGRSSYRTVERDGQWWVVEEYDLMGHNRSRDEREEWYGPFEAEALAFRAMSGMQGMDRAS